MIEDLRKLIHKQNQHFNTMLLSLRDKIQAVDVRFAPVIDSLNVVSQQVESISDALGRVPSGDCNHSDNSHVSNFNSNDRIRQVNISNHHGRNRQANSSNYNRQVTRPYHNGHDDQANYARQTNRSNPDDHNNRPARQANRSNPNEHNSRPARQASGSNPNVHSYRQANNSVYEGHNGRYQTFKLEGADVSNSVLVIGRLIAGLFEDPVKPDFVVERITPTTNFRAPIFSIHMPTDAAVDFQGLWSNKVRECLGFKLTASPSDMTAIDQAVQSQSVDSGMALNPEAHLDSAPSLEAAVVQQQQTDMTSYSSSGNSNAASTTSNAGPNSDTLPFLEGSPLEESSLQRI
jgi:hypothetical protein